MRITTIPFNFTALATSDNYQQTWPLPANTRITHLYALGEPAPSQLLWLTFHRWSSSTLPAAGIPPGQTIFDDLIQTPRIRLGRIPTDMDLDITLNQQVAILCYCRNDNATAQQCMAEMTLAMPD